MDSFDDIEDLQGDLVLQQVMLSSIDGAPDDEFEEERKQRREEIVKLKKRIASLKNRKDGLVKQDDQGRLTRSAL